MSNPEDGRRSFRAWAADVVGHSYRERGLRGMLARGPQFVREDLLGDRLRWWLLVRPLRGQLLDREALRQRTSDADALWDGTSPEPVTIEVPAETDLPESLQAATGTYEPERPFVAELRDARLLGEAAIGLVDGEVVLETTNGSEMYLYFALEGLYDAIEAGRNKRKTYRAYRSVLSGDSSLRPPDSVETDPPTVATPLVPHWRSYYHWVIEYLPKLRHLERYEDATGRRPTLLLPPDPKPWLRETLRLAGWDENDWVEWVWPEARIDRLVVPSHRNQFIAPHDSHFGDDFNPAPEDVRWLARRMRSNVDLAASEFSDRVYVSRRDSSSRRVVDEERVLDALEPLGFEAYALAELPVADQIRLFAGAETVLAPHGAGLVNLLYGEDLSVFELFSETRIEPYYFSLARQLDFDYDCAVYPAQEEDIAVDPDDLHERISTFLDRG
jgi:hypothetical protein